MPDPLNNVPALDIYSAECTLVPQYMTEQISIIIAHHPVYAQFETLPRGLKVGAGTFPPDEFLLPGVYNMLRRVGRIRFKNANPGQVAYITCRAE
jgi:hypothetical protein